ncbi:hypothetical protein K458DRAFT_413719 [Lentithecium fluviatile CBS 122367]|uniref:Uncharacterized protein n=1 Tax=Lentithecium fluviatile CBS 122367 TaxID=1168545 RepID=A0A6G1JFU7_9PLEO|nr:hypothetical protein K458DRAFT_413719 [Lentithecium fluviatile CBS 122367]
MDPSNLQKLGQSSTPCTTSRALTYENHPPTEQLKRNLLKYVQAASLYPPKSQPTNIAPPSAFLSVLIHAPIP